MTNYPNHYEYENGIDMPVSVSSVMKSVYFKMCLGLLVTAFIALWCASSATYLNFFLNNSWMMLLIFGAEVLIVIGVSGATKRISSPVALALFFLFALINGLALAPIFLIYTGASISKTFFITAGTFAAMSVYGYFTSQDLSRFGSILVMALFGLIICSVVNIFFRSSTFDWILSAAGVLIFIGLTAWDTQQIKTMAQQMPGAGVSHLSTIGALTLYLDFINLFIYLLRFFGNRD